MRCKIAIHVFPLHCLEVGAFYLLGDSLRKLILLLWALLDLCLLDAALTRALLLPASPRFPFIIFIGRHKLFLMHAAYLAMHRQLQHFRKVFAILRNLLFLRGLLDLLFGLLGWLFDSDRLQLDGRRPIWDALLDEYSLLLLWVKIAHFFEVFQQVSHLADIDCLLRRNALLAHGLFLLSVDLILCWSHIDPHRTQLLFSELHFLLLTHVCLWEPNEVVRYLGLLQLRCLEWWFLGDYHSLFLFRQHLLGLVEFPIKVLIIIYLCLKVFY